MVTRAFLHIFFPGATRCASLKYTIFLRGILRSQVCILGCTTLQRLHSRLVTGSSGCANMHGPRLHPYPNCNEHWSGTNNFVSFLAPLLVPRSVATNQTCQMSYGEISIKHWYSSESNMRSHQGALFPRPFQCVRAIFLPIKSHKLRRSPFPSICL